MVSRRIFMKNGGLTLVSLGFAPSFLARTVEAARQPHKILITIFQRGAVDGLNMVVPFAEDAYYRARPSIAIPRPGRDADVALDLDGFFGLHPRMASLAPWFTRGQLAIVHATGSHDSTRSHFDAQDYMESGTPGRKGTRDGWLNRFLQARRDDAATTFRAVSLTPQLPRALQGMAPALAINRLSSFGIRAGGATEMVEASFEAEYAAAADQILGRTGREAFDAVKMLASADPMQYEPADGARYPRTAYGEALKQIAQLVKADVGLEVAFAESGNWDHHVSEGGSTGILATRLDDFSRGIAALATDLGDRMDDIVVLDDVGVRPSRLRKRQPRYRSWARQRHAGTRRTDPRGQGLQSMAGIGDGATVRGSGPRRHDRFPRCLRRSGRAAPRREESGDDLPGPRRTGISICGVSGVTATLRVPGH